MKKAVIVCLLVCSGAVAAVSFAQTATDTPKAGSTSQEPKATKIEGWVRDIACPISAPSRSW